MDYGATYRDIRASSGWTGEEIASRRDMRLDQPGPRLVDSHACAVRTQLDSTLFITAISETMGPGLTKLQTNV